MEDLGGLDGGLEKPKLVKEKKPRVKKGIIIDLSKIDTNGSGCLALGPNEIETKNETEIENLAQPLAKVEKKPRSQKQIEAFERCKAIRDAKRAERKTLIQQVEEEEEMKKKKQLEDKIVKKAIGIKKKQVLTEKLIDETISDDDIPDEIVQKIIKKKPIEKVINKKINEEKVKTFFFL